MIESIQQLLHTIYDVQSIIQWGGVLLVSAIVFVENEWHMPDSSRNNFLSESHWIKRDGKWYRSGQPGTVISTGAVSDLL